ncbi:10073_t:CDS:10 [Funneliformis caledonium]|uniref:Vacuolar fusion protein MON1 n=1 Tax=Funneliformis caledonium TaxID=1117310 RepID=A0A9N8WEP2_9GLOM|nr:10073_t:CDS:10 [Funneliformis caledonium]
MSFSLPRSPLLSPMSPIMEDVLSDSNSVITSDEPLSPTLQPQRKYSVYKAKPTTQLSLSVPSTKAYSSSSAGSSVKSFNAISNLLDSSINGENRSKESYVDDYLTKIMNRSNSASSTDNEYLTFCKGFIDNKKRNFSSEPESDMSLDFDARNESIDSDSSIECKMSNGHSNNLDMPAIPIDEEYSGYRRKYGHEDPQSVTWSRHRKHFFILSSSGKPIYTRYGDESRISSYMGVIQAIISFFVDAEDSLRCINAGNHKFVFLLKGPLYLVAVSRTNESESQLNYLYNQILSVLTSTQLTKIYEQRMNFDLRILLGGTEPFLDKLANSMSDEPGFMLGSIQCVRMSKELRDKVGNILQIVKSKDLLYAMLITNYKLITLLRLKKHSLHSADLHLVFNMVNGSSTFRSVESWTPICLPKFNNKGFLHAYVCYITANVCLLLISPDKDKFFELSDAKNTIVEQLTACDALQGIEAASQSEGYSIADIGVAGLRHFIYKSKTCLQYTSPAFLASYNNPREKRRLFKLYRYTHDRMHSRVRPLKVHYYVSPSETILGWITATFELYAAFGPLISKTALTNSSLVLLKWIKKEEENLFIMNSPVF